MIVSKEQNISMVENNKDEIAINIHLIWSREWQSTLVLLPGESHGQRSLVGYSPRGHKELDMTERLTHAHTHTHTLNYRERCVHLSSYIDCLATAH